MRKRGRKRKTHEEFIMEMFFINPNIEILTEYIDAHTKTKCKCRICGHEWDVTPTNLLNNHGCPKCGGTLKKTHEEFVKEMFKINPDIIITSKYINTKTKVKCKCRVCGYEWEATPIQLLYLQYGCHQCAILNMANLRKKTHEIFVEEISILNPNIEILSEYIDAHTLILCKCKTCGYEWYVKPTNLLQGHGCHNCKKSKGEDKIEDFLKKNNTEYILHYKYDDLLGVGNRHLSYDFYIVDYNFLIEYNGKQHYEPIEYFGGEQTFKIQQEHDKRKREYAKSHNINLLEIPYWDFENIETILESYLLKQQVA